MNTRHWNLIQGFALAALLPLFAACSSEGDELLQSEEKQPVQVNITRAATDGNDWSWQDNDQIGLNITNYGESTPNSYTLTYNNNVWTSNPATIEATLPATIQAWWPIPAMHQLTILISYTATTNTVYITVKYGLRGQ